MRTRSAPSTADESAASNYASTRIAYYVSALPLLAFLAPAILEAIKPNCGAPRLERPALIVAFFDPRELCVPFGG
jgi:hypothetical protein